MTETEMKEMYQSILNGDEWECRTKIDASKGNESPRHVGTKWIPFKLGNPVYSGWEYRKVEKWYICKHEIYGWWMCQKVEVNEPWISVDDHSIVWFEGTKEECEKWIAAKEDWLKETDEKSAYLKFCKDNFKWSGKVALKECNQVCFAIFKAGIKWEKVRCLSM